MVITIELFSFIFVLEQTQTNKIVCSVSFKALHKRLFSLIDLLIIETIVFLALVIIAIVNHDTIEYYMNGVPIILLKKQTIIMITMNYSPIPRRNNLEANNPILLLSNTLESRLHISYSLIKIQ